jgi:adenosylcobinamide-GDP ribazoletransferase
MAQSDNPFSGLFVSLSFFSRLPLPASLRPDLEQSARLNAAAVWFPAAGVVIALLPALLYWLISGVLPSSVAAGIAIGAGILITGGLHEDGLADCADGLGGSGDRRKALEIMRDSRIGTYGVAALVFSILLRWLALASLPPGAGALGLIVAHSAGRASITTALAFSSYGREKGAGTVVAGGITQGEWAVAIAISLAVGLLLGGFSGLVAAGAGLAAAAICLLRFEARIGAYTGDTLGAMEQAAEIAVLLVLAAMWGGNG